MIMLFPKRILWMGESASVPRVSLSRLMLLSSGEGLSMPMIFTPFSTK